MPQYITKIRTESGDLQIDYNALANLPSADSTLSKFGMFADAQAVGRKITQINNQIASVNDKVNEMQEDTEHTHKAEDIQSGVFDSARIPLITEEKGGLGVDNHQDGLTKLLSAGGMILSKHQYGDTTPIIPGSEKEKNIGRVFFVKV
jgi:hypothetical protein